MNGRILIYTLAISVQILLAAGQVTLKTASVRIGSVGFSALKDMSVFVHVAIPLAIAAVIYFTAACLWIFVLHHLPVNRAFLFVSLAFVFVPVLSYIALGEYISPGIIFGTILIVSGIVVGIFF